MALDRASRFAAFHNKLMLLPLPWNTKCGLSSQYDTIQTKGFPEFCCETCYGVARLNTSGSYCLTMTAMPADELIPYLSTYDYSGNQIDELRINNGCQADEEIEYHSTSKISADLLITITDSVKHFYFSEDGLGYIRTLDSTVVSTHKYNVSESGHFVLQGSPSRLTTSPIYPLKTSAIPEWVATEFVHPTDWVNYSNCRVLAFDSLSPKASAVVVEASNGNCIDVFLVAAINRHEVGRMMVGTECDHDQSRTRMTYSKWRYYGHGKVLSTQHHLEVPSNALDINGDLPSGQDFWDFDHIHDSLRQFYVVSPEGDIEPRIVHI